MRPSKTLSNVTLYTLGETIPRVLSFLLLPLLTQFLSVEDYGISSYTNTVVTFLYVLTTLSINTYALRTYYQVDSLAEKKKLLGNIFLFMNGWGFLMLCLEAMILPLVLNYFSIQIPFYPYFFLAIIINFFDVISIIPLVAYRVDDDARSFVMLSVGRTILQYLLIIVFVAYFKMGLLGSYIGRLAGSLPFGIIYFLILSKKGIFSFNFTLIKKALYFSLPLLPGVLSYLLISMLDRIILERYVTLEELGLYSVAATLTLTLNIVIQALYKTFEQKIFREHGSEGYPALLNKLYKIYIVSLFIPGFILSLFVKEILLFFTSSQYYSAYQYVVYLVIAVIISGMNTFFGTLLIADNRKKVVAWSSVISAGLSVVTNLILIKSFGVLGACIGSILSFLFVYIFYLYKVVLINKFIAQQISFVAIFLASGYLIPDSTSMFVSIIAKLALFVSFLLFIKIAIHIQLSSVQNLVFSKVKQRRDRS